MTYIYGLTNPDTGNVRYVGKADDPCKRYREHLRPRNLRGPSHKKNWLNSLLRQGKRPGLIILTCCPKCSWQTLERGFIAAYRIRQTCDVLTNLTSGGESFEYFVRENDQLTEGEVVNARELYNIGWTVKMLARYYHLRCNPMRDVVHRKTWKNAPEHNYYHAEKDPRWAV